MKFKDLFYSVFFVWILVMAFQTALSLADDKSNLEDRVGFHNQSELGLVLTSGNTRANTFNVKQKDHYKWGSHLLRLDGSYLSASSFGVRSARSYTLGLRFEENFFDGFSGYVGQDIESDIFAGYLQRYNSDIGEKYAIIKHEGFAWNGEAGYRYTVENRTAGGDDHKNFLRAYTEVLRDMNKNVSAKFSVEYLPNLSSFADYRLNSELCLSAMLDEVFSIKSGYALKYISQPLPGVAQKADTVFTTALVAKF